MKQDIGPAWPKQAVDERSASTQDVSGQATSGLKSGLAGGLVASLPVLGPAFASLCASCVGVGSAAALGAVAGFLGPVAFAVAAAVIVVSARRALGRCRTSCTSETYPRARMIVLATMLAVAAGSFALATFVVAPAIRTGVTQLQNGFDHVPSRSLP